MSEVERLDEAIEWTETWIGDAVWEVQVLTDAARAYRDLLANGQRVEREIVTELYASWFRGASGFGYWTDEQETEAVERIVSKLLSVYPKEAENE